MARVILSLLILAALVPPSAARPTLAQASIRAEIVSSFEVPGNRAAALAWGADSLWLADVDGRLFQLDAAGVVRATTTITMPAYDLAWRDEHLWAHDGSRVYRLDAAGRVEQSLDVGYWSLSGAEWVGDTLYVGDYNFSEIHAHSSDGTHLRSWETTFFGHPTGIAYDGSALWIGDSCEGETRLNRYSLLGAPLDYLDLSTLGISCGSRQRTHALAWDGRYLWYSSDELFTVYRIDLSPSPLPAISGVTPRSARANAGAVAVTISGQSFTAPVSATLEDVALRDVTLTSPTTIRATVPVAALTQGVYDLSVSSGGRVATLPEAFTVTAAQVVAEPTETRWGVVELPDQVFDPQQVIGLIRIDPSRPERIYLATDTGTTADVMLRSTDDGRNWSVFVDDFRTNTIAIDPTNSQILYAPHSYGSFGDVNKSVDGGSTWVRRGCCGNGFITDIQVDPHEPATVYTGVALASTNTPGVFQSTDGGTQWRNIFSGASVLTLAIDPSDSRVLYAGARAAPADPFGVPRAGGVYRSADAGLSWTQILSKTQVNAIVINPRDPQLLYAATEGAGIFKTTDGGASWRRSNTGLAGLFVRALVLDPVNPHVLYAGLYEGGVFRSVDGGATWRAISNGLRSTSILSLAIDPQRPYIVYAGTNGGGLHKWVGPPPIEGPHAHVVDASGAPLIDAVVYHNGALVKDEAGRAQRTNIAGDLALPNLRVGDTLVAMAVQEQRQSPRANHDGWAYQVNTTSLTVKPTGSLEAYVVAEPTGRQTLTVRPGNPLVAFNLVVSIEWDADDAYIAQIARAMRGASDALFDMTDGQMAFGQVAIYDQARHWAAADIQIATRNTVRPHAYIGGIVSPDTSWVIRIGRGWDGLTGDSGPWDQPNGYRTIAHEFGHYALYLYDSYFGYARNDAGDLTERVRASCTGPENRDGATAATNATVMDYQYTSSELSMLHIAGLWHDACRETAQWQLNEGESDWQTLARFYADQRASPRWRLTTPADRGGVMAGPAQLPPHILDLPQISTHQRGAAGPARLLTVVGPTGEPQRGAVVDLYRTGMPSINQGLTDTRGELLIYGATANDTVRAGMVDGSLYGEVVVSAAGPLQITMRSTTQLQLAQASAPQVWVTPISGQDPTKVEMLLTIKGLGPVNAPNLLSRAPGEAQSVLTPIQYSPATGEYTGTVSLSATQLGSGQVELGFQMAQRYTWVQATYRLQQVQSASAADIFSDDGNLALYLDPAAIPGSRAFLAATTNGTLPGPLPAGMVLVSSAYTLSSSGAIGSLVRPASLQLKYDAALVNSGKAIDGLQLYRWSGDRWAAVASACSPAERACTGIITALGSYALLAPAGAWVAPEPYRVILPLIQTDGV